MKQTLYQIPSEIGDLSLFGAFGIISILWACWCVVYAILFSRKSGWNSELLSSLGVMALIEVILIVVVPRIMVPNDKGELGIAIRGYGVMFLLGIVSGVGLSVVRGRKVGMPADLILSLALWVFAAGMIGARGFYVIEYWQNFQRDTLGETISAVLNITEGGLVVFGGLIGALGAILFFARKHKLPLLPLADMATPGMMLGLAFGRIGCFFNGCCFGDVCDAPWLAVEFPANTPPHVRQIEQGRAFGFLISGKPAESSAHEAAKETTADGKIVAAITLVESGSPAAQAGLVVGDVVTHIDDYPIANVEQARYALLEAYKKQHWPLQITTSRGAYSILPYEGLWQHSRPVHPAQLYSSFDAFLATLLLLAFTPLSRRDGETFALFLSVHAVSRFLLEEIRIDEPGMFGTTLSISQHISIGLLALGVGLWLYIERKPPGFAWPRQEATPAA